jgi:hypothetical protein
MEARFPFIFPLGWNPSLGLIPPPRTVALMSHASSSGGNPFGLRGLRTVGVTRELTPPEKSNVPVLLIAVAIDMSVPQD